MDEQKQRSQKIVKPARSMDGTLRSTNDPVRHSVSKLKKNHRVPFMFLIAIVVTVFIASRGINLLNKKHTANSMNKAYSNEIEELVEKERIMQAELQSFSTDAGIEQEIREKFRVTKEGEELVVVVPQQNQEQGGEQENRGLFSFLRKIFK